MRNSLSWLIVAGLISSARASTSSELAVRDEDVHRHLNATAVCGLIGKAFNPTSKVYYPETPEYLAALYHSSPASSDVSACVVEPNTPQELAKVLRIAWDTQTRFAIKGGGHSMNPGFSSTKGVHISLAAFKEISYVRNSTFAGVTDGHVFLGAGLTWDEVYPALDPQNVTVAGGRAGSGVGIGGFLLGGGISFWSNMVGMTVDMILEFEVVLPTGTVKTVTAADEDLFWALKGGGNNLGIVTRFTLKAIPYTQVWGGIIYNLNAHHEIADLTVQWEQTVTDPKASVLPTFAYFNGTPIVSVLLFYADATPPPGLFDPFLNASGSLGQDLVTGKMADILATTAVSPVDHNRAAFHSITFPRTTKELIYAAINEMFTNYAALEATGGIYCAYSFQTFMHSYLSSNPRTSDSAYPTPRNREAGGMPLDTYWAWLPSFPQSDTLHRTKLKESLDRLQTLVPGKPLEVYSNYRLTTEEGTTLEMLYGAAGAKRMRRVAKRYDPKNVMSLTGGFRAQ